MIVYPKNWRRVGLLVTAEDTVCALLKTIERVDCDCLAFSGGLDSSLLLYCMCQMWERIKVFTIGRSDEHQDIVFAKAAVDYYRKEFNVEIEHHICFPNAEDVKDHIDRYPGDRAVELFYRFVGEYVNRIIAGDGVDEFMCGYYAHGKNPSEKTYYEYLHRMQAEQLIPLNENSGSVRVYLPYLNEEIVSLMSQIPLEKKVDSLMRKKFLVEMAKGKVPDDVIGRRKYGFCDALVENKGEQ